MYVLDPQYFRELYDFHGITAQKLSAKPLNYVLGMRVIDQEEIDHKIRP